MFVCGYYQQQNLMYGFMLVTFLNLIKFDLSLGLTVDRIRIQKNLVVPQKT
jgi:hypothetical protein